MGDVIVFRKRRNLRRHLAGAALLTLVGLLGLMPSAVGAQPAEGEGEASDSGIFAIKRIEISVMGGPFWGDTILSLPEVGELTNDTGSADVLDFSGRSLAPPIYDSEILAPEKTIEAGWMAGVAATFYLGDNFGVELSGSMGRSEAVVEGQAERGGERFEWDRATITVLSGGASMIYHVGKRRLRPHVNLGFGGVINRFDEIDDVTALYFQYGGGLSYRLNESFLIQAGVLTKLFTYDTDEIALDETVNFPSAYMALTWRHVVPPPEEEGLEAGEELSGL